jgi:CheY-like chemotaxis protein
LTTINVIKAMKVLIAEDEYDIALLYKTALEKRKHHVIMTYNGEDCLKIYNEEFQEMRFRTFATDRMPFDVVILDHKMPEVSGIGVAEEILAINPHQRIIFVSAYVKEFLQDSIKKLKQSVELRQKPFGLNALIDTIEDKDTYRELQNFNVDVDVVKAINPTHEQITDLLDRLRDVQKGRAFQL